jgi:signal transduction histidine kinase
MCYPGKLNQAFLNILANASQAIDGPGKIFIKTSHDGEIVTISIKDTGKGMTAEVKKHLFEPFFTTKPVGEGTGLGLPITYGIIEEHDGNIEVYSEPGKGSEFVITLPAK